MARITVEDCLKRVENRFLLVNMVAKRVRQIREGSEYLVNSPKNEDIVVSLREVAAGKIVLKTSDDTDEVEAIEVENQIAENQETEEQEVGDQETAEKSSKEKEEIEEAEE